MTQNIYCFVFAIIAVFLSITFAYKVYMQYAIKQQIGAAWLMALITLLASGFVFLAILIISTISIFGLSR